MSSSKFPHLPLYDPNSKIKKFRFEENFEYIRLKLLETGSLYEEKCVYDLNNYEKEWRRPKEICSRPFFIDGKPDRFDAMQGKLDDCWLVSAMEAITMNDDLMNHVVPPDQSFNHNYVGAFHFRIWQLGTWYDVVVDDRLPVYKSNKMLCYTHSKRGDIFWAALLEKAYAKFHSTSAVSYEKLYLGYAMTSLQDFSGGLVETLQTHYLNSGQVKRFVTEIYSKHALICCGTRKQNAGILANHYYTVTKVFKCSDDDPDYHGLFLMRLLNPWGYYEWEGKWRDDDDLWKEIDRDIRQKLNVVRRDDGEFWMNEIDFIKNFDSITICHLGPGQYQDSRSDGARNVRRWRTTSFSGEWIKNISAGGHWIETRHKNPQFIFQLEWPKHDANKDGKCTVVIQLVQGRTKTNVNSIFGDLKPLIAFYIYSLTNLKNLPMPLDKMFFENNKPMYDDLNFDSSDGCAFVMTVNLNPGKYCIVPCTFHKNEQSQFLLRVCSENFKIKISESDTQISKSFPTEEQRPNEYDEVLNSLFADISQGEDEIDWICLKEILEKSMSSKRTNFGMIMPFLKCVWHFLYSYFSPQPSIEYESGDVVFTKDACRSMIAMLDDNHSGKLSFTEFSNLWNKICFWTKVYEQHRDETEGHLLVVHLRDALSSIGYTIDQRTLHSLSYVYANEQEHVCLPDFILSVVTLETVLALYEKEHDERGQRITFTLEEWVKHTLFL